MLVQGLAVVVVVHHHTRNREPRASFQSRRELGQASTQNLLKLSEQVSIQSRQDLVALAQTRILE